MFGAKYLWILSGKYSSDWWKMPRSDVHCTPNELKQALEGYIGTDIQILSTSNLPTVSGKVENFILLCHSL